MAVRNAGVDAVLVSRTVRVSTDIRVTPGHSYGSAGFYGMWGGAFSTAPNVYTVQNVEVESQLFDVKDLALLWSGSSTTNPLRRCSKRSPNSQRSSSRHWQKRR